MTFSAPRLRQTAVIFLLLATAETLSYAGYRIPELGQAIFVVLVLAASAISWHRLENGLLFVLAELFIGGKGYLFSLEIDPVTISIRHALFAVVCLVWLIRYGRSRRTWPSLPTSLRTSSRLLILSLLTGVLIGGIAGYGWRSIFFDANAFLYAGLAVILLSPAVVWTRFYPKLLAVVAAAAVLLGIKSLLALGLFVKLTIINLKPFYKWIRDTGVGEIAPIFGGTYRVFFQSQIYGLLSVAILAPFLLPPFRRRENRWLIVPVIFGLAAVIVSLSRSFWIGGFGGLAVALLLGFRWFRWSTRQFFRIGAASIGIFLVALTLNSWALNFPYPYRFGFGDGASTIINRRLTEFEGESAVRSRSSLLRALGPTIIRRPILGYGFGKSITYQSSDPRQINSPSGGRYTTSAFELGYLDQAVKLGLIGLSLIVAWIFKLWQLLLRQRTITTYGFLVGLAALLAVHSTTPYLNHPLGIGFLVLALGAARLENRPR